MNKKPTGTVTVIEGGTSVASEIYGDGRRGSSEVCAMCGEVRHYVDDRLDPSIKQPETCRVTGAACVPSVILVRH